MTVGELLGGGFDVLKRRPKELVIWTVIQLAISVALVVAIMPFMTSLQAAQQQALASGAPGDPLAAIPPGLGLFLLAYVLILVWFLMLFTAVVRGAAATGEDKFAWLRFGGDELRLIGLGLLYIVATIVVWIVLSIIFGVIIGIGVAASATAGIGIGIVCGVLIFCIAVWLSVRISLIAPVFVLEKSFAVRKGWRASKGHFWTLFLTYLVMTIAYIVLEIIIVLIMYPDYFSSIAGGATDPAQALARQQAMMASLSSPSMGMIAMWLVGTALGTAAMVYYVGVIATAAISATGYSKQDLAELEGHFE